MPKNVLDCTILREGSSLRGSSKSTFTVHWEVSFRGPNHPFLRVFPSSQVWLIPCHVAAGGSQLRWSQPCLGFFWKSSNSRPELRSHLWEKDVGSHLSSEITQKQSWLTEV